MKTFFFRFGFLPKRRENLPPASCNTSKYTKYTVLLSLISSTTSTNGPFEGTEPRGFAKAWQRSQPGHGAALFLRVRPPCIRQSYKPRSFVSMPYGTAPFEDEYCITAYIHSSPLQRSQLTLESSYSKNTAKGALMLIVFLRLLK